MTFVPQPIRAIASAVADLRRAIGWSQAELGKRAGFSQSFVSLVENNRIDDLTLSGATRLLEAMGARLEVVITTPFLGDRARQRDPVHAKCSSYVATRLQRSGWLTATEVEVGGDRSRGWIDVLAYHPHHRLLLVIELKTEIRDIGAIERSLGWYEHEAWAAARRLNWRPRQVVGCLLLLDTDANAARLTDNRATFRAGFPIRASILRGIVDDGALPPRGSRAVAVIDPRSRRRDWLRPSRLDGRPTPAPYADYAAFMRCVPRPRSRPSG